MRFLRSAIVFVLSILIPLATTASSLPRVSGVVGQEGAWVLAIIETDAGACSVVSRGDKIGDGIVADISSRGLQITYDSKTEFLPLQGGSFTTTADDRPLDAARTASLKVSREQVVSAQDSIVGKASSAKKQSVNEILGLPLAAQISAINGIAVTSQQEASKMLLDQLKSGTLPRINISGVPGLTEIYVVPDSQPEQQVDNSDIPPWERVKTPR
ncbi:hypothetical protein KI809_16065 [Geobacter pelophilus]|jgi:hypothetical protein|uniref:Uncharacterized protein n=1 Tax=Geoanaerobacter pelophilus TaxID=60036 RepID=A0AAW4LBQ4_9BACT|nr:hypothetical protein [Geoanaerobacter pelophilus]MBT0665826.1 hypothetical protein [Geoanaerobacter pelophilus]